MQKNIIGVDLGGTSIRVGKVADEKIVKLSKAPTPSTGTEQEVLDVIFSLIGECIDSNSLAIGIGVPSVVDTTRGIVYDVVHIPSWKEVHLKEILENKFKVPVFINNDSNCFAVGEKTYGKGKNYRDIVGMTIGTGLGLGLIVDGRLFEGRNCGAGEFGMVPYLDQVYENYCSGYYFTNILKIDAALTAEKAKNGDAEALQIYSGYGKHVGNVIKSILYAYDPDIVIIGGSLAKAFDLYKNAMLAEISDFAYRSTLQNMKIEISELADSPILGAAALYMNAQKH